MMKFHKNLIRSFKDLPGYHSLLIHSLIGCNFHCFGCHNYEELVLKKEINPYYSPDDIINHLEQNGYFFDAIIFSGGEFLLNHANDLMKFLNKVRSVFKGIIIINTNGSFPEKMKQLLDNKLVDGFHIDMKLPFHLLDIKTDEEIYKSILGIKPTKEIVDQLLTSINLVVKHNSIYSQVRTVNYPILSNEFFIEIKKFVKNLNKAYGSAIPYHINEFMNVNENT